MGLLKGALKLVLGKSMKKAGVKNKTATSVLDIADDLIVNDQEVQDAIRNYIVSIEGKYSELKTKFEGVVKTLTRPILTFMFSINLIIMVWLDKPINQYVGYCTVILVCSWCGTKAFRDWKKAKVK